MSFMSNFFSRGSSGASSRSVVSSLQLQKCSTSSALAKQMHFSIFHWRSHTDIRPSCNVLLVHDWLSTNDSWTPLISSMRRVPQPDTEQQLMLQQPLTLFCPDLPNHGKSPALPNDDSATSSSSSSSSLEFYATTLLDFAHNVIPSGEIHIVGFGTGGSQIALLTAASLEPERFGSFVAILGGNQNDPKRKQPLILDSSLDAADLSKSCGDLTSLHQADDFLSKLPSAAGMSDLMRFNTGTSHCGSTRWELGVNRKGTPSLQAKSAKIRWNSNVVALRSAPDFGVEIDQGAAAKLAAAAQATPVHSKLAEKAFVIQDSSPSVMDQSAMKTIRTVFPDPSILQVPNAVFDGLSQGARGPTKEDANLMVVPFLSLYQDHRDWAQMNANQ